MALVTHFCTLRQDRSRSIPAETWMIRIYKRECRVVTTSRLTRLGRRLLSRLIEDVISGTRRYVRSRCCPSLGTMLLLSSHSPLAVVCSCRRGRRRCLISTKQMGCRYAAECDMALSRRQAASVRCNPTAVIIAAAIQGLHGLGNGPYSATVLTGALRQYRLQRRIGRYHNRLVRRYEHRLLRIRGSVNSEIFKTLILL